MCRKMIFTFDYELYLGQDSGTIEKCIIEPTNEILNIFKKNNSKAIFFIDSTFLIVLKKDYNEGYKKVKDNILKLLELGHDVGLHIHPHWIDSYFIENKKRWGFTSYKNFRIHNLSKKQVSKIINNSYQELNSIVKEFSQNYDINSFRAGGWSIQPFEYIKNDLKKIGIKYDFSVTPGLKKVNLPKHYYDYTKTPKKIFWRFENDILIEDNNGSFIEVPTTIISMNIFDVFRTKKIIKNFKTYGDGKGADNSSSSFINKVKKLKPFIKYSLSSDYMSLDIIKKYINIDQEFLVYVAHPKNFSEESFKILSYLSSKYKSYDYRNIS